MGYYDDWPKHHAEPYITGKELLGMSPDIRVIISPTGSCSGRLLNKHRYELVELEFGDTVKRAPHIVQQMKTVHKCLRCGRVEETFRYVCTERMW